jgi:putative thioredoxin
MRLPSRLQAQSGHAINPLPREGPLWIWASGEGCWPRPAQPKTSCRYEGRWATLAMIDTMIRDDDDHRETDDQIMDLILGQNTPAAGAAAFIIDGTQATFMKDVIEASRQTPVIVDFWATWCGPCKTLTPMLEKVVTATGGRVRMVKIDTDKNRALVQQLSQLGLPLQSIPTVAAFWQGQIADIFQGALPESEIRRFVEALLKLAGSTMPAADLLAEARAAQEDGDLQGAVELYRALLADEPERPEAWGGLIRCFLAGGREEEAEALLAEVPAKIADHADIAGARSALVLAVEGKKATGRLRQLEARLVADPTDHEARYDLATALNALNRREEAAEALLDIMKRQRGWNGDAARLQLLKFFEAWGLEDPASISARRRLSALLFS